MHEQQPVEKIPARPEVGNDVRNEALRRAIDGSPRGGEKPHIWAGSVENYLAAQPWGRWVSAARSASEVEQDIADMLRRAPSVPTENQPPTWAVFSHSGFGRHQPSARASIREYVRRAAHVREDVRAYSAWASFGDNERAWLLRFRQAYQGRFDRLQDWVVLEVERAGLDRVLDEVVPAAIRPHVEISIDSLAHELRATGAIKTAKDPAAPGEFVFRME